MASETIHYDVDIDADDATLREGDVVTFTSFITGPHEVTTTAAGAYGHIQLAGWTVRADPFGDAAQFRVSRIARPVELPADPYALLIPSPDQPHRSALWRSSTGIWMDDSGNAHLREHVAEAVAERGYTVAFEGVARG